MHNGGGSNGDNIHALEQAGHKPGHAIQNRLAENGRNSKVVITQVKPLLQASFVGCSGVSSPTVSAGIIEQETEPEVTVKNRGVSIAGRYEFTR